jgi:DNA-binding LacI/PurR family transcriptional regulator
LVSAVAGKLAEMIRSRALQDGTGLPSERKLSVDLAVSRGIVRAAIRELKRMGLLETKPRCRPVVRSQRPAPLTVRQHVGIWLWPNTGDYAAASILKGIQSAGLGQEVRLIVGHPPRWDWESRIESEARFLQSLTEDPVEAGAIVWYLGGERNLPALRAMRAANVPLVFIDRLPPDGFAADYVGTNNRSAAAAGVRHLLELGHRRIAMITNMDKVSSVLQRESGYRSAMAEAGIEPDPVLIQQDSIDEPEGVEAALNVLLNDERPPTAIFCVNDHLALQVYEALQSRGVSVPGTVSVLGFDGLLRWVPGGGYLTTHSQDFERIGQLAAELVLERMTSGPPEAYRHLLLDAPLFDRGSTAAPPTHGSHSPN